MEIDYKQQWLAHLPKLLMSEYRTELSIGFGSGILIGESAKHSSLEKIVAVEIARAWWRELNFLLKRTTECSNRLGSKWS